MRRLLRPPHLARLPLLACAGLIGFLFATILWNAAVERQWPKLRIRSAEPLAGVTAPAPAPLSVEAFLSGDMQRAVSTGLGQTLPVFPISVRAKSQLLFSLFGVSGAPSVVVGRDGQLFERPYIEELCGRGAPPSSEHLAGWADSIAASQQELRARGKGFAYLISPSKAARLSPFLPPGLACPGLAAPDKLAPFRAALETHGVAHVDGASLMTATMEAGGPALFPRGGTHWNALGAAIAFTQIAPKLDTGSAAPLGPFDFEARPLPRAQGADRDLLDLMNLLRPDDAYPSMAIDRKGRGGDCPRAPRLVLLGGSFLREIVIAAAAAACPPQIDHWFSMRADGVFRSVRYRTGPGDIGNGEKLPVDPALLRAAIAAADAVLLEENESNIAAMPQVGALATALAGP